MTQPTEMTEIEMIEMEGSIGTRTVFASNWPDIAEEIRCDCKALACKHLSDSDAYDGMVYNVRLITY